jgi:bifunctional non-homologous end joining protein LigD
VKILDAMQTPDDLWRVEVVQRGRTVFYRLVHGDDVIDGLAIATLQRLLAEAGVDIGDLVAEPAA